MGRERERERETERESSSIIVQTLAAKSRGVLGSTGLDWTGLGLCNYDLYLVQGLGLVLELVQEQELVLMVKIRM